MITTYDTKPIVYCSAWIPAASLRTVISKLKARRLLVRERVADVAQPALDWPCSVPVEHFLYGQRVRISRVGIVESKILLGTLRKFGPEQLASIIKDTTILHFWFGKETRWSVGIDGGTIDMELSILKAATPEAAVAMAQQQLNRLRIKAIVRQGTKAFVTESLASEWSFESKHDGRGSTVKGKHHAGVIGAVQFVFKILEQARDQQSVELAVIRGGGLAPTSDAANHSWICQVDDLKLFTKDVKATFDWHIPSVMDFPLLDVMRRKQGGNQTAASLLAIRGSNGAEILVDVVCGKKGYALILSADEEQPVLQLADTLGLKMKREC